MADTEYAPSGTLETKIQKHRNGLLTPTVCSFTQMILLGLRSLHEAGYVHGHLHSENVLLFLREGHDLEETKIFDVGIVKRIGDDLHNRQLLVASNRG
ncbi:unnamed protein product [Arabis nemorensis]|uniref:Protein kinase domain-containing protein n=1 Tax=Arabis nemorensis TaxID=586526 RepID=A0A565AWF9_9BRAS|nr:unnamed protein product [Arabis nemorensis]